MAKALREHPSLVEQIKSDLKKEFKSGTKQKTWIYIASKSIAAFHLMMVLKSSCLRRSTRSFHRWARIRSIRIIEKLEEAICVSSIRNLQKALILRTLQMWRVAIQHKVKDRRRRYAQSKLCVRRRQRKILYGCFTRISRHTNMCRRQHARARVISQRQSTRFLRLSFVAFDANRTICQQQRKTAQVAFRSLLTRALLQQIRASLLKWKEQCKNTGWRMQLNVQKEQMNMKIAVMMSQQKHRVVIRRRFRRWAVQVKRSDAAIDTLERLIMRRYKLDLQMAMQKWRSHTSQIAIQKWRRMVCVRSLLTRKRKGRKQYSFMLWRAHIQQAKDDEMTGVIADKTKSILLRKEKQFGVRLSRFHFQSRRLFLLSTVKRWKTVCKWENLLWRHSRRQGRILLKLCWSKWLQIGSGRKLLTKLLYRQWWCSLTVAWLVLKHHTMLRRCLVLLTEKFWTHEERLRHLLVDERRKHVTELNKNRQLYEVLFYIYK